MIRAELWAVLGKVVLPWIGKLGFETRQLFVTREPGGPVFRRYTLPGWSRLSGVEWLSEREHVSAKDGPVFFRTLYAGERVLGDPYLTQIVAWRLRLHVFHRGDNDPDGHDHPWSFLTFPLTSYVEEVTRVELVPTKLQDDDGRLISVEQCVTLPCVVRAFRFHRRPATYTHRVLGRWNGRYRVHPQQRAEDCMLRPGRVWTIVWSGPGQRAWGFRRASDGCWIPWRRYVFGGGKTAPCE